MSRRKRSEARAPGARLSTRPKYLGLGFGCSITALTLVFSGVAMALPGGLGELTTIRSGILITIAGIAIGWLLSLRYFMREPIEPGSRGLHFPVYYQFEDWASWRWRHTSTLDALAYCIETIGQAGWLILMPLHRGTRQRALKLQARYR